jgi:hypothetical protein
MQIMELFNVLSYFFIKKFYFYQIKELSGLDYLGKKIITLEFEFSFFD